MATRIIKDFDGKFLKRLARALSGKSKKVVHVGFPEGGPEKENGISVAGVAAVHEFGGGNVPERPFVRTGIRRGIPEQMALNKANLKAVVHGTLTVPQALGQLGLMAAGHVQQEITEGTFEPLQEATINRKGSSKPLIDTGQMRQSVTYEIPE